MPRRKTVTDMTMGADWADPKGYDALAGLDRAGWAWEWLKRDRGFAAVAGPLLRSPAGGRPGAARPRVLSPRDAKPFERWGVFFRRRPWPGGHGRLLAARFQSIGARRGSAARCPRPRRRLRYPEL